MVSDNFRATRHPVIVRGFAAPRQPTNPYRAGAPAPVPPHPYLVMPKSPRPAAAPDAPTVAVATEPLSPTASAAVAEEPVFPLDVLRSRADRLARAARESCRQHERCSATCGKADVENAELTAVLELTAVADRQLGEAAEAYEKASARLAPDGPDAAWWHKANGLWLAAREHVRRHSLGDRLSKRVGNGPSPGSLRELTVEYALEASAILSLKQAVDEYCKSRPVS